MSKIAALLRRPQTEDSDIAIIVLLSDGDVAGVFSSPHRAFRRKADLESEGHHCKAVPKVLDLVVYD